MRCSSFKAWNLLLACVALLASSCDNGSTNTVAGGGAPAPGTGAAPGGMGQPGGMGPNGTGQAGGAPGAMPGGMGQPGAMGPNGGGQPNAGVSQDMPAGKKVFMANGCSRCHALNEGTATAGTAPGGGPGGAPAGGPGGGFGMGKGPDLSHVGADAAHTAEWLSEHIRNPKAHQPQSRMPGFEGRISEEDLKTLSEYLAGLK